MRLRVFVFEDNDTLRSVISSILDTRGYEVFSYSEPLLCPAYLDRECPHEHPCEDVLITDLNMPHMTGLDFIENQIRHGCKAIAKNRAVLSGDWTQEQRERAERLGCQVFEKPFDFNTLMRWLDECEMRVDRNRELVDLAKLDGDAKRETRKSWASVK
jgi:CheY-like chemotaxis protein